MWPTSARRNRIREPKILRCKSLSREVVLGVQQRLEHLRAEARIEVEVRRKGRIHLLHGVHALRRADVLHEDEHVARVAPDGDVEPRHRLARAEGDEIHIVRGDLGGSRHDLFVERDGAVERSGEVCSKIIDLNPIVDKVSNKYSKIVPVMNDCTYH